MTAPVLPAAYDPRAFPPVAVTVDIVGVHDPRQRTAARARETGVSSRSRGPGRSRAASCARTRTSPKRRPASSPRRRRSRGVRTGYEQIRAYGSPGAGPQNACGHGGLRGDLRRPPGAAGRRRRGRGRSLPGVGPGTRSHPTRLRPRQNRAGCAGASPGPDRDSRRRRPLLPPRVHDRPVTPRPRGGPGKEAQPRKLPAPRARQSLAGADGPPDRLRHRRRARPASVWTLGEGPPPPPARSAAPERPAARPAAPGACFIYEDVPTNRGAHPCRYVPVFREPQKQDARGQPLARPVRVPGGGPEEGPDPEQARLGHLSALPGLTGRGPGALKGEGLHEQAVASRSQRGYIPSPAEERLMLVDGAPRTLSANEAACVTGVPLRQVHRVIDAGVLGRAAGRRGGSRAGPLRRLGEPATWSTKRPRSSPSTVAGDWFATCLVIRRRKRSGCAMYPWTSAR